MTFRLLITAAMVILLLISPSSPARAGGDGGAAQPPDTISSGSTGTDPVPSPGAISSGSTAADSASSPGAISADPGASRTARVRLLNPYWYYRPAAATTLTFYPAPALDSNRMLGFESYRASRGECALQGAAIGSTIGMNIAALGLMTGKLDQKEGWIIGGALTTLGVIYGGIFKAEDPKWYNKIRIGVSGGK